MSRGGLPRLSATTLGILAAATLTLHLVTTAGYGYFRDELYYLACGQVAETATPERPWPDDRPGRTLRS